MKRMAAHIDIGLVALLFIFLACFISPASGAPPAKWDRTADVIVVGAGGAGLAAAVTAADKGASVIVLEKMPVIGGNTIISGGFLNAADPKRQPRQKIQDSPDLHYRQTIAAGDFRADPEKVKILAEQAPDAVLWLESLGMQYKDDVRSMAPFTRGPMTRWMQREPGTSRL
jgi:urocanate reductase